MNIQFNDFNAKGYHCVLELTLSSLLPFIHANLKKKNAFIVFFWIFTLAIHSLWLASVIFFWWTGQLKATSFFGATGLGILLFFIPVIPLHEWIHGVAYKLLGAPHVKFGAKLSQMVFFAIAPDFVVNKKEFTILALAPFVIGTILLISLLFLVTTDAVWTVWTVFLLHSSGCAGDFALLGYFHGQQDETLVTVDTLDGTNFVSRFYSLKNPEQPYEKSGAEVTW